MIDASSNGLYIQNPPNNGTETAFVPITSNGTALDFTAASGFDIASDVQSGANATPVSEGSAFAALTVAGVTHLYTIDLVTGAATDLGPIGTGASLDGLAVGQTTLQ